MNSAGDLQSRQHQSAGSMQHDVHGDGRIGEVDGAENFLGVVHVNVAKYGEAEKAHHLLPVHQQDDA